MNKETKAKIDKPIIIAFFITWVHYTTIIDFVKSPHYSYLTWCSQAAYNINMAEHIGLFGSGDLYRAERAPSTDLTIDMSLRDFQGMVAHHRAQVLKSRLSYGVSGASLITVGTILMFTNAFITPGGVGGALLFGAGFRLFAEALEKK